MNRVEEPSVYLLARTELLRENLEAYLHDIGDPDWRPAPDVSDGETLIEAAGRLCYRSWQPYDPGKPDATNRNVTKTRAGNQEYLANLLAQGHGSVLEHVTMTFLFRNVSRVFTHELVRHRAGMAYSQESLRYVRLDELAFWFPKAVASDERAAAEVQRVVAQLEEVQRVLARLLGLDSAKDFAERKRLTSVLRRLAPMGLGTTILATGNLRAWRHIITMRSSEAAEEEMRLVAGMIATICKREFPSVFQDMQLNEESGEWQFGHLKV